MLKRNEIYKNITKLLFFWQYCIDYYKLELRRLIVDPTMSSAVHERELLRAGLGFHQFLARRSSIENEIRVTYPLFYYIPLLQANVEKLLTFRNAKISNPNYFCNDSNTKTFKINKDTIGYTEFEQLKKDRNVLIIDIRNHEEVATYGEIPNTINIQLP